MDNQNQPQDPYQSGAPEYQPTYDQPNYEQQQYPQQAAYGQPYTQPGAQYGQQPYIAEWSQRNKLAAGLFGILLGTFGVHNFYLGRTSRAVTQLLISVLSLGVLAVISSV